MIAIIIQITAFLLTILALVSVHEAGHMVVARVLGIKVLRYSIGFGKILWRRTAKSGIEYVISVLPLGGYVKLLDEREGKVLPEERHLAFNTQPLWKRVLVVIAGPITNILFAIIAYWIMFGIGFETLKPIIYKIEPNTPADYAAVVPNTTINDVDGVKVVTWQNAVLQIIERLGESGTMVINTTHTETDQSFQHELDLSKWKVDKLKPDPLNSLGMLPYSPDMPATFEFVTRDGPAWQAGLRAGDTIVEVNNEKIEKWSDLTKVLVTQPDVTVPIRYERNGDIHSTNLKIGSRRIPPTFRKVGYIGVRVKSIEIPDEYKMTVQYSLLGGFVPAVRETYNFLAFNFVVFKKMIFGEISLRSLGGPITIFRTADQAFRQGVIVFLGFLALISIMLAFINLLPIPGLDGGHLLLFLIEAILRRPLSIEVEILMTRIGFLMLLGLLFAATFNDLLRLLK